MDISIDRYREVITLWLEHIFASKVYAITIKRVKYDINHILSTCCNCQNHWTVQLAHRIMAAPGYEVRTSRPIWLSSLDFWSYKILCRAPFSFETGFLIRHHQQSTKANYRERVENAVPHLAAGPQPAIWYHTAINSQEIEDPLPGEKSVEQVEHVKEEELEPGGWARANQMMWKPMAFGNIIH